MRDIVVVGGSIAAVTAADALRSLGFDGRITLLSDEQHPPYSRPPLSKAVLTGADDAASVSLAALDGVEIRLGCRAVGLDLARRRIVVAGGEEVPYDGLVIATGARARSLGAPAQTGEQGLRSLDDAMAMRSALAVRRTVLIVGGGFIGMEVASACRACGVDVTVVDREPPLVRQFGPYLADLLTRAGADAGVRFVVSPGDVTLIGDETIRAVRLGDGRRLEADVILSAAGCRPNVEWLARTGLAIDGGLHADERCRVAPGIVAAGDVVAFRGADGVRRRQPFWMNAVDQARCAAAALLQGDSAQPFRPLPYFWTDQFGLSVKICGALPALGQPQTLAGSAAERNLLLQWRDGERPLTAAAVNYRLPIVKLRQLAAA